MKDNVIIESLFNRDKVLSVEPIILFVDWGFVIDIILIDYQ